MVCTGIYNAELAGRWFQETWQLNAGNSDALGPNQRSGDKQDHARCGKWEYNYTGNWHMPAKTPMAKTVATFRVRAALAWSWVP